MVQNVRSLFCAVAIAAALRSTGQAAPENITSVNVSTTTGTASTTDGLNYDNTIEAITDFSGVSGTGYTVISSAPNAFVQRNGTPNQSSVWYAISGTTGNLAGVNQTNYGSLLKSNNLLEGADNVFDNGTNAAAGNIERLDYTWNTALGDISKVAFAVFERGVAGAHDGFTIAIVTGVDPTTHLPNAYGGYIKVAANWGGATNLQGNPTNQLLRYSNGDDLTALTNRSSLGTDQNTQGVGGVVIRATDFNLPAGTSVYGYSLMASDVNPTTASDLLNVANTTVYPANTTDSVGGGIDLAAVNGLQIQYVPEPTTLAFLGVGGLLLMGWMVGSQRRRQQPIR